jgi:hypothetical protein
MPAAVQRRQAHHEQQHTEHRPLPASHLRAAVRHCTSIEVIKATSRHLLLLLLLLCCCCTKLFHVEQPCRVCCCIERRAKGSSCIRNAGRGSRSKRQRWWQLP